MALYPGGAINTTSDTRGEKREAREAERRQGRKTKWKPICRVATAMQSSLTTSPPLPALSLPRSLHPPLRIAFLFFAAFRSLTHSSRSFPSTALIGTHDCETLRKRCERQRVCGCVLSLSLWSLCRLHLPPMDEVVFYNSEFIVTWSIFPLNTASPRSPLYGPVLPGFVQASSVISFQM